MSTQSSYCHFCGEDVPAGEGRATEGLLCCANCYEEEHPTCEWMAPRFVDAQLKTRARPTPCPNPKLPGMYVCSAHASKEALVLALTKAHDVIDSMRPPEGPSITVQEAYKRVWEWWVRIGPGMDVKVVDAKRGLIQALTHGDRDITPEQMEAIVMGAIRPKNQTEKED